jgi:hypothetical protein
VGIWDETKVDWSGAGLPVAQLFERAYADRSAVRALAHDVGIGWPTAASTLSHSQLWVALLTAAASDHKLPALAAELLDDPERALFVDPLVRVLGDQLGLANAVRVAKRGLPTSEEAKSAVVASMDFVSTTEAILPPSGDGQLEAINLASGASLPLEAYAQTILSARRRVALLRRGQSPVGSGFLVGPDLLLTAAHVIRPDGLPGAGDLNGIDAVLDFHGEGRAVAETGIPVPVKELLRASPATDEELAGGQLLNWDASEDRLDFALLRLGRAVGNDEAPETGTRTRGWYRLTTAEPDLSRSAQVMVLHFPDGEYLTWSVMKGSFQSNPARTRLRYRSNTKPGSSGGPIIDERGRLLALHHYGRQPANQAVPIWRVAQALDDLLGPGAAPLVPPLSPGPASRPVAEALLVGNRPVVNRAPLRQKLWGAMTTSNAARSLMIVGAADTGVSWSWWLLNHLAGESPFDDQLKAKAPHGVKAMKIDLREDIAQPVAQRRAALVRAVSRPMASETLTDDWVDQAARQIADFKEWCRRKLPADGPQWWIFVDSIDETSDVEQHGIGEVLKALVDLADDRQVNLRLVLAGRKANQLEHGSLSWAERDDTVGMTRQEVKTWLQASAEEAGRVVKPDKLEGFLDEWFPTPTPAVQPIQLSLALRDGVTKVSA